MAFLVKCVILTALTVTGLVIIYFRLPRWIRKIILVLHIPVDIAISAGAYMVVGPGTVTGIFVAAATGVSVSLLLLFARHERINE